MNNTNPSRNQWTSKTMHAVGIAVILIGLAVLYSVVYCNMHQTMETDAERSEQLRTMLATSAEIFNQQQVLQKDYQDLRDKIINVRRRVPTDLQEGEFVEQVQEIATISGLTINNHFVADSKLEENISSTVIHFKCNGSYASICKFLNETSQLTRITEIANLKLESSTNSNAYPFQVSFVLYYGASSNDTDREEIL